MYIYTHTHIHTHIYTGCPITYRTRHFFNNSKTNEDIATTFEQEYVRCVRNEEERVCSAPNIFICVRIIKEMPGSVASGSPCIYIYIYSYCYVCSVLHILLSLCCSMYCLCVNVYCTTATGSISIASIQLNKSNPRPYYSPDTQTIFFLSLAQKSFITKLGLKAFLFFRSIDYKMASGILKTVQISARLQ